MRFTRGCIVAFVLLAAVGTVTAQTGGLKIVVLDPGKMTLPGATVVLSNDQGFVKETASVSDAQGEVLFPVLRAGPGYFIQVSMPGFAPQRHELRVKINETQTLTVVLTPEITETVVVEADSKVVELDKTEVSTKFSDDFIQDLPVPGRFYQGVLTMAPGVQDDNGDGEVTVHGSRNRDFKAMVGGVSNVDPLTGQTMALVNPNSIEEIEVITAGAGAAYGRAQGGFANIIQKQGSNEFEGLFEVIYRSSKLDGNGASSIRSDLSPQFQWYQPSLQVSGPILRDKLWYRLSGEYIFREDPINVGAAIVTTTIEQGINSSQVTWQVSPRNKLAVSYDWNPLTVDNVGVSAFITPESAWTFDNDFQQARLSWQAPYSPKIFFDSLIAYQDLSSSVSPQDPTATNDCVPPSADPSLRNTWCTNLLDSSLSGAYFRTTDDASQRFTLATQATVFVGRFLGANHQLRFGMSVQNERYSRIQQDSPQLRTFFQTIQQDPDDPDQQFRRSVVLARVTVPELNESEATANVWSLFFQDQIKPVQNLTITAGVAIDREYTESTGVSLFDPQSELGAWEQSTCGTVGLDRLPPECNDLLWSTFTAYADREQFRSDLSQQLGGAGIPETGLDQIANDLKNRRTPGTFTLVNTNVSPRLSIAWDPWSNGKTKFSASAGRYYNTLPLIIPLQEQNAPSVDLELLCGALGCSVEPSAVGQNLSVVDRNLGTPYQDEWTLSFERELFAETLLRVTYINRKYRDQIQDVDINHAPGDYGSFCRTEPVGGVLIDGEPDGIFDDCVGRFEVPRAGTGDEDPPPDDPSLGGGTSSFRQLPDGIPDAYIQNALFGDVYFVSNINQADYEGITLEMIRRQYRGWEMVGSYTYSEAVGDGEDFNQQIGDDQSLLDNEFGFQSNDRRHVVKLNGTTITPWGFRFGTSISWQSGLPWSILENRASRDAVAPSLAGGQFATTRPRIQYTTGARNDQRNKSYWNVDVKATKEFRVGQRANLQVSAEIFNLFNDDTYQIYNLGIEIGRQINGVNDAFNRFGRRFQLGARVTF